MLGVIFDDTIYLNTPGVAIPTSHHWSLGDAILGLSKSGLGVYIPLSRGGRGAERCRVLDPLETSRITDQRSFRKGDGQTDKRTGTQTQTRSYTHNRSDTSIQTNRQTDKVKQAKTERDSV